MKRLLKTSVAAAVFFAGAAVAGAQTDGASRQAPASGRDQTLGREGAGGTSGIENKAQEGRSTSERREQGAGERNRGEEPRGSEKGGAVGREGRSTMEQQRQGEKAGNAPASEERREQGVKNRESQGRSVTHEGQENVRGGSKSMRSPSTREEGAEGRSTTREREGAASQGLRERGGREAIEGERGAQRRGTVEEEGRSSYGLSNDQRVQVREHLMNERVARVDHVDFDVKVGTVVPRGVVHVVPLPPAVVRIVPRFRGFDYFVVGDEIVIVDPRSLRIVAVLPA